MDSDSGHNRSSSGCTPICFYLSQGPRLIGVRLFGSDETRPGNLDIIEVVSAPLMFSPLFRLANDGDAAAPEEESALVPVLPTYAVMDPFADPQYLKDLSLTSGLPSPLRLENHPISDLALNHRRTSLNLDCVKDHGTESVLTQTEGIDCQRAGPLGQVGRYVAQLAPRYPWWMRDLTWSGRPSPRNEGRGYPLDPLARQVGSNLTWGRDAYALREVFVRLYADRRPSL